MLKNGIKKGLLLVALQTLVGVGAANAVVISDTYIGAQDDPFTSFGLGRDVLGGPIYEVYGMEVTFAGSLMSVTVNTDFISTHADNTGGYVAGDLFISTDGWSPYGTASESYMYDDASNGEDWEYAFDSSAGDVIQITNPDYIDVLGQDPDCCRHGQEVTISDYSSNDVTDAAVSYSGAVAANSGLGGLYDYNYVIDFSVLGIQDGDELGFHWVMTCGNDVIEGMAIVDSSSVAVTEPNSFILLAFGAVALVVARRSV